MVDGSCHGTDGCDGAGRSAVVVVSGRESMISVAATGIVVVVCSARTDVVGAGTVLLGLLGLLVLVLLLVLLVLLGLSVRETLLGLLGLLGLSVGCSAGAAGAA